MELLFCFLVTVALSMSIVNFIVQMNDANSWINMHSDLSVLKRDYKDLQKRIEELERKERMK